MKHVTTLALALAIFLSGPARTQPSLAVEASPQAAVPAAASEALLQIHTSDLEDVQLAKWAVGRFKTADFVLPSVSVHFHHDTEPCLGNHGLHTPLAERRRIDICVRGTSIQARILLHELAHAWVSEHFAADRRDSFLELRGLSVWHDDVTAWNEQGTEHAAEIIAWGVAEQARLPGRIADHDLDSVTEAFQFLTGRDPISTTIVEQVVTVDTRGGPQA